MIGVDVYVPLCFFANRCEETHCRIANRVMSSGASKARIISLVRHWKTFQVLSSMLGMFGWTATQMHETMVAMQVQMMLHMVLVLWVQSKDREVGSVDGVGIARMPKWKITRVNNKTSSIGDGRRCNMDARKIKRKHEGGESTDGMDMVKPD